MGLGLENIGLVDYIFIGVVIASIIIAVSHDAYRNIFVLTSRILSFLTAVVVAVPFAHLLNNVLKFSLTNFFFPFFICYAAMLLLTELLFKLFNDRNEKKGRKKEKKKGVVASLVTSLFISFFRCSFIVWVLILQPWWDVTTLLFEKSLSSSIFLQLLYNFDTFYSG